MLGSFAAIEGEELNLHCYATSSNPPVQIRWWLGNRELNSTAVIMEEVGLKLIHQICVFSLYVTNRRIKISSRNKNVFAFQSTR